MPLHRVIIFCAKPETLAAFYAKAFGMAILSREGTFVDVGLKDRGSARIGFHKGKKQSAGAIKLSFYSSNVAIDRARLISLGASMGKIIGTPESLCFCDGKDAEGNVFQLTNRA